VKPDVVTIAVAGGTASGKTTISTAILQQVGEHNMVHLLHDSYYKSWQDLAEAHQNSPHDINFDHPNSLDTTMMIEHIKRLQAWEPIEVPTYDFVANERLPDTIHVKPRPVVLVEGILVLVDKELRDLFDMKIFVDTDADLRFIRRLQRDLSERGRTVESVIEQYYATVRPMHNIFVEPSKRHADIVVPRGGRNAVAIAMIADRLRWILHLNNIDTRPEPGDV
jgi:uridine kinase